MHDVHAHQFLRRRQDSRATWLVLAGVVGTALATSSLSAQDSRTLPFAVGERLTYTVSARRFGHVGEGTLSVEGPEDVRGNHALVLRFIIKGGVGPASVRSETVSWVEPDQLATLRFRRRERRFLRTREERVEVYPSDRRWTSAGDDGDGGFSPTDAPLDELSFIYYLRTLSLAPEERHSVSRHYQHERNPVEVAVLGRDTIATPAGTFATIVVEMRVKDSRHYERHGVLRINLSDDAARIPVRIETAMPIAGATTLTLTSRRDAATESAPGPRARMCEHQCRASGNSSPSPR